MNTSRFLQDLLLISFQSTALIAILAFFIKKYVERAISHEFDKRAQVFAADIEKSQRLSSFFLDKQMGIYPEILETIYRLRNIISDGFSQTHAYKWHPDFRPLCAHLTENLFKYRLFLPESIFSILHEYKQLSQDLLMFIDVETRAESMFDAESFEIKLASLEDKQQRIDDLYLKITDAIKDKMRAE